MRELRLIDPYGATVPGTWHTHVPDANAQAITERLMQDVAPKHSADNDGINGYRFHLGDYRVQNLPTIPHDAAQGLAQAA